MAYYYTRDHLGSVREMCDSSGTIISRMGYGVYGQPIAVSGTILPTKQYAGMYWHPASGYYFTRAGDGRSTGRPYKDGKFPTRDPIGENGGINLYDYVGNDPINATDPLGEDSLGYNYELTGFLYVIGGQLSLQVVWDFCQKKWCATVNISVLGGKGGGSGVSKGLYGGGGFGGAGTLSDKPIVPGASTSFSGAAGGADAVGATGSVTPTTSGIKGTLSINGGGGGFVAGRHSWSFTSCGDSYWGAIEDATNQAATWAAQQKKSLGL